VGYEKEADYYEIAEKRFQQSFNNGLFGTAT